MLTLRERLESIQSEVENILGKVKSAIVELEYSAKRLPDADGVPHLIREFLDSAYRLEDPTPGGRCCSRTSAEELWQNFRAYAAQKGLDCGTQAAFGRSSKGRFRKTKTEGRIYYLGLTSKAEEEVIVGTHS
jgi:hypothetical protein